MDAYQAYQVLGLSSDTSEKDLKKAWREQVRIWHPDQNPDSPDAAEKIQEINAAYEFLQKHHQSQLTMPAFQPQTWSEPKESFAAWDPYAGKNETNFFPSAGEDIKTSVSIDFVDSLKGIDVSIDLERWVVCPLCGGRSLDNVSSCSKCQGMGRVIGEEAFFVSLPSGVSDGDVIRVESAGNAGFWGGKNGDLLLSVHVEGNGFWEKRGDVLWLADIPLALEEMVLGTSLAVPTPKGWRHLRLNGPINVQKSHRIPNAGILSPDGTLGDMIISFRLVIPEMSAESKADFLKFVDGLPAQDVRKELESVWKPVMDQL